MQLLNENWWMRLRARQRSLQKCWGQHITSHKARRWTASARMLPSSLVEGLNTWVRSRLTIYSKPPEQTKVKSHGIKVLRKNNIVCHMYLVQLFLYCSTMLHNCKMSTQRQYHHKYWGLLHSYDLSQPEYNWEMIPQKSYKDLRSETYSGKERIK